MPKHRTWITINRAALRSNLANVSKIIPKTTKILPIVKANGYGHGMSQVVKALPQSQFWGFGVASGDEAQELATFTRKPVFVMSSWQTHELPSLIRQGVVLVVWNLAAAKAVERAAHKVNRRATVHLKIDTGTTRIGVLPSEVPAVMRVLLQSRWLKVAGLFSHFADSEAKEDEGTLRQLQRFTVTTAPWAGTVTRHIACTASLRFPQSHLDMIRLGIGLYGAWPSPSAQRALQTKMKLTPVLSWYTTVLQTKWIPKGTTVGYARTWRAKRKTLVGILPVGYADGYSRLLGNNAEVLVGGHRRPVIGRVCMNLIMIDCTQQPRVAPGDKVTLIGRDGNETILADELAYRGRSIALEVFTRLAPSIPRLVV